MSSDIPELIRACYRQWGRQKRRIWSGRDWYLDNKGKRQYDIDGYAESLLGRIREERDGASQGERKQHWPEVLRGNALDVQRALPGMPEPDLYAFHFTYVWDPEFGVTVAQKAAFIGVKKTRYHTLVECAEKFVFARLDRPDPQLIEQVYKIVREALQIQPVTDIKAQTRQKCPPVELNLRALNRPILSMRTAEKPAA